MSEIPTTKGTDNIKGSGRPIARVVDGSKDLREEVANAGLSIGAVATVLMLPLAALGAVILSWTVCNGVISFVRSLAGCLVLLPLAIVFFITLGCLRALLLSFTSKVEELLATSAIAAFGFFATLSLLVVFRLVAGEEMSSRFIQLLNALINGILKFIRNF